MESGGATNGYHENYLFPRTFADDPLIDRFMTSVVATRLWAMSGTLRPEGYVMSQKVWGTGGHPVTRYYERMTAHGNKPMIIVRESDADTVGGEAYTRAEIRMSDPVPSIVNRYLNFSMMSLTLRIIEQQMRLGGDRIKKICLREPVPAAKHYARALGLRAVAETEDGRRVTALDTQEAALELMETLDEKIQLPEDEHLAIPAIRGLIDGLRRSRPRIAEYTPTAHARIDFAAKYKFIVKERSGVDINSHDSIAVNRMLAWDRILPESPGRRYWQEIERLDPLAGQVLVLAAAAGEHPRAAKRADIIDGQIHDCRVLDWNKYRDPEGKTRSLGDPCP